MDQLPLLQRAPAMKPWNPWINCHQKKGVFYEYVKKLYSYKITYLCTNPTWWIIKWRCHENGFMNLRCFHFDVPNTNVVETNQNSKCKIWLHSLARYKSRAQTSEVLCANPSEHDIKKLLLSFLCPFQCDPHPFKAKVNCTVNICYNITLYCMTLI